MIFHPTAKALMKKTYMLGVPVAILAPFYMIPIVFLLITKWLIGSVIMVIPPVIVHLVLRKRFRKDDLWLKYAMEELKSKTVQRPYS